MVIGLFYASFWLLSLYLFASGYYMRKQARDNLRHAKYLRWKMMTRRRW